LSSKSRASFEPRSVGGLAEDKVVDYSLQQHGDGLSVREISRVVTEWI
jgi:hypothetical protein